MRERFFPAGAGGVNALARALTLKGYSYYYKGG